MTQPPWRTKKLEGFSCREKLLNCPYSSARVTPLPGRRLAVSAPTLQLTTSVPSMPQRQPAWLATNFHVLSFSVSTLNQLDPMGQFWSIPALYQRAPLAETAQTMFSPLESQTIIPSTL